MTEAATSQERRKIGDMSRGKIECFKKGHAPGELHTGDFRIGQLQRANAKKAAPRLGKALDRALREIQRFNGQCKDRWPVECPRSDDREAGEVDV